MPLGTSCSMYCTTPGACRNLGKYLHLLVWGSIVLCKPECYCFTQSTSYQGTLFELHFCKNVQIQIHISIFGIISFTYFKKINFWPFLICYQCVTNNPPPFFKSHGILDSSSVLHQQFLTLIGLPDCILWKSPEAFVQIFRQSGVLRSHSFSLAKCRNINLSK